MYIYIIYSQALELQGTWVFPVSATLYFYSSTFFRQIVYFLLHYIYFRWFNVDSVTPDV